MRKGECQLVIWNTYHRVASAIMFDGIWSKFRPGHHDWNNEEIEFRKELRKRA